MNLRRIHEQMLPPGACPTNAVGAVPQIGGMSPAEALYCQACGTAADQCVENPHGFAYHHQDRWPRAGVHTLVPYRIGQTNGLPSAPLTGVHHVGWDSHAQRGTKPYADSDTTGGTW